MISQRIELSEFSSCLCHHNHQTNAYCEAVETKMCSPDNSFLNTSWLIDWIFFLIRLCWIKTGLFNAAFCFQLPSLYQTSHTNLQENYFSNQINCYVNKSSSWTRYFNRGYHTALHIGLLTCQHVSQIAKRIMRMLKQSAHWSFTGTQAWHHVKNGFNC